MSIHTKFMSQLSDEDALARAMADFSRFEANKSEALTRAERYDAIYKALDNPQLRALKEEGDKEDDEALFANTHMPIGAAVVDGIVTQLMNFLFPNENYFEIAADNWEDSIAASKITAHLRKRHKEMGFIDLMEDVLIEAACFDYAITGARWLLKPGYKPYKNKDVTLEELAGVKLRHQNPRLEMRWVPDAVDRSDIFMIPFHRCYHDPDAERGFDDSIAFCDDRDEKLEDLMARAKSRDNPYGKYKNIDQVIELEEEKADKENPKTETSLTAQPAISAGKTDSLASRRIKIKRHWSPDHVLEWANDILIWRWNMPGWVLQRWGMFKIPKSFKMMGVLQRIERNCYDINATLNSRRDFQNLVNDPWAVISDEIEDAGGKSHPGKKYIYHGSGNARDKIFVGTPGINVADRTVEDIGMQVDMINRVTVSENNQGVHKGGRVTATETIEVSRSAAGKTARLAKRMEWANLVPMYLQLFLLEATLMRASERVLYFGKHAFDIFTVRPEDYAWNSMPIFIPRGTSDMIDEPVKIQQFMAGFDRALNFPDRHNWDNILAHMWSIFAPRDYHNFIADPRAKKYNIPQDVEIQMIAAGRTVEVSPANNHREHLQIIEKYKKTPDYKLWPEKMKFRLDEHAAEHAQHQTAAMPMSPAMGGGRSNSLTASSANSMRGIRPQSLGVTP